MFMDMCVYVCVFMGVCMYFLTLKNTSAFVKSLMTPCLSASFLGVQVLFFFFLNYLFIYLWLFWVFVSARGLSPVAASGGHSSSRCAGLPLSRPLPLRSAGSRRAGSAIVAHGPSCSTARGILPDQGSNPCPLLWQADSQPLRHQGSPGSSSSSWLHPSTPHPRTRAKYLDNTHPV